MSVWGKKHTQKSTADLNVKGKTVSLLKDPRECVHDLRVQSKVQDTKSKTQKKNMMNL